MRDHLLHGPSPVAAPPPLEPVRGLILYLDKLTVSFGRTHALESLCLYVEIGELRCVVGPPGAGKTTLIDVVTGRIRPRGGEAYFRGDFDLTKHSEPEIASFGIGRTFRPPALIAGLTVLEHLVLAGLDDKRAWTTLVRAASCEERERAEQALQTVGLVEQAHRAAGTLTNGQKRWLEIGMLLTQNPRLLLLDEALADLTEPEAEKSAELFCSLASSHTLVVLERELDRVASFARRVTVLDRGRAIAEGSLEHVRNDPHVRELYVQGSSEYSG